MTETYLHGGSVLTLDSEQTIYDPGVVIFDNNVISFVGSVADAPAPSAEAVIHDCTDLIIMPGLVNSHTHTGMTYFRNLLEDMPSIDWFKYELDAESYMSHEDVYWAALLGAYELLRQGITCTADRFSNMDKIAEALIHAGIRAVIAPSLVDRDAEKRKAQALNLIEQYGVDGEGLIQIGLGPVGPDTCSTELLQWTREQANHYHALIFIHLAQSKQELKVIAERGYKGSVRYLDAIGFLDSDVVAAHCIYVDSEEIELLKARGVRIAHCPTSNAKIEGKIAPIVRMQDKQIPLGIGTDCVASNNGMDMFSEMKIAGLMQKVASENPESMPVQELVNLATRQSAEILNLGDRVGSLEIGKRADLISIRRNQVHLQPWHNIHAGLVYATRGFDVQDVWVDGVQRVAKGQILADDVDEAIQRAATWAQQHKNNLLIQQHRRQ